MSRKLQTIICITLAAELWFLILTLGFDFLGNAHSSFHMFRVHLLVMAGAACSAWLGTWFYNEDKWWLRAVYCLIASLVVILQFELGFLLPIDGFNWKTFWYITMLLPYTAMLWPFIAIPSVLIGTLIDYLVTKRKGLPTD